MSQAFSSLPTAGEEKQGSDSISSLQETTKTACSSSRKHVVPEGMSHTAAQQRNRLCSSKEGPGLLHILLEAICLL
jgi:hypothetical protein